MKGFFWDLWSNFLELSVNGIDFLLKDYGVFTPFVYALYAFIALLIFSLVFIKKIKTQASMIFIFFISFGGGMVALGYIKSWHDSGVSGFYETVLFSSGVMVFWGLVFLFLKFLNKKL